MARASVEHIRINDLMIGYIFMQWVPNQRNALQEIYVDSKTFICVFVVVTYIYIRIVETKFSEILMLYNKKI